MKMLISLAVICAAASPVMAAGSHFTRGYIRNDGAYVQPHYSTNSDSTKLNNWSTQGNYNPYTGRQGTVDPYRSTRSNPFGSPLNTGRNYGSEDDNN